MLNDMVAKFVLEKGEPEGLVLALEGSGEEWVIGRDPDTCQIVIEDAAVSRRHVVCRKTVDGISIENLSATNAVYVNGQEITEEYTLNDGDKVKIGKGIYHYSLGTEGVIVEGLVGEDGDVAYEEEGYETIFGGEKGNEDIALADITFGMEEAGRWSLKVINGPNAGAEFPMDTGKEYVIGTDTTACDIIFHDASISRKHVLLKISDDDVVTVEDNGSSNGTFCDEKRLEEGEKQELEPHTVITLGSTVFVVIDKEAEAHTIVSPVLPSHYETKEEEEEHEEGEEKEEGLSVEEDAAEEIPHKNIMELFATKTGMIVAGVVAAVVLVIGTGTVTLFKTEDVTVEQVDVYRYIREALRNYPEVQFTYNKASGKLFLLGHVLTKVDKEQLMYNIQNLEFANEINDNIIIDELVWSEMNQTLQWNTDFRGITMRSPKVGSFILTGFLDTNEKSEALNEYVSINFPYIDRLENLVVVEEEILTNVDIALFDNNFINIEAQFIDGEIIMSGTSSPDKSGTLRRLIKDFEETRGVRAVRNLVVERRGEDSAMVDISERYIVTGSSRRDSMNLSVVINGRILTRGDILDGMRIISIRQDTVFLEREGFKYRIDYKE